MDVTREQIAQWRALDNAEPPEPGLAWGDLADIQGAFEQIDPATLPEPAENATISDMLDELESRLPRVFKIDPKAYIVITVTRSAGKDGAVVVFIDTNGLEPSGSDGGPGLRVRVNDAEVTECGEADFIPFAGEDEDRKAPEEQWGISLTNLRYDEEMQ